MSLPTASPPHAIESRVTYPLRGGPSASVYGGTAAVIGVEAVIWHLYFVSRFPVVAWVFTALNAAVLVSLWFHYRAASRPRIVLGPDSVDVSVGRRKPLRIPWSNIDRVEPATWQSEPDPMTTRDYVNASSPFVPNILITLRSPTEIRYAPGIAKAVRIVGIRVEAPDEVLNALSGRLEPLETGAR